MRGADGTYDVEYDDGDVESGKPASRLRAAPPAVGRIVGVGAIGRKV